MCWHNCQGLFLFCARKWRQTVRDEWLQRECLIWNKIKLKVIKSETERVSCPCYAGEHILHIVSMPAVCDVKCNSSQATAIIIIIVQSFVSMIAQQKGAVWILIVISVQWNIQQNSTVAVSHISTRPWLWDLIHTQCSCWFSDCNHKRCV